MQLSNDKSWNVSDHDHHGNIAELRDDRAPVAIVAEDDDHMRPLLVKVLRDEGFRVLQACSGWQLLDVIGRRMVIRGGYSLDLIVSDVRIGGVTGLEVLAGIRENDWSTPVVLITAFGDPELHAEAARLGALAVLDKPFDFAALRALVRPWARSA